MKLNIRVGDNLIKEVEVKGTPFGIEIAPGYKFFAWEIKDGVNDGEITEFQTGMSMGINNKCIKEYGIINK